MKFIERNANVIDINCDLGEGINESDCAIDAQLMPYISSCNIACGGHAGNELTMNLTIQNAKKHGLNIGAHPGYPDKKNFGRVSIAINVKELEQSLIQQLNQFKFLLKKNGAKLNHIKFHGALYNDLESDYELALALVKFCKKHCPNLYLLGLANGNLSVACEAVGFAFIAEAFMDRAYSSNGKLVPRDQNDAVHHIESTIVEQALSIATAQRVSTNSGSRIKITADSICLHGDHPKALTIAKSVHQTMLDAGIKIQCAL